MENLLVRVASSWKILKTSGKLEGVLEIVEKQPVFFKNLGKFVKSPGKISIAKVSRIVSHVYHLQAN